MSRRSTVVMFLVLGGIAVTLPASPAEAGAPLCQGRRATIVGENASNTAKTINGTEGPDVIVGLRGQDIIFGRGGNDLICAGGGIDVLYGGAGADRLYGGDGADNLSGGPGRDRLFGGLDGLEPGDQGSVVRGGDTLSGGPGDDFLSRGRDTRPADSIGLDVLSWQFAPAAVSVNLRTGRAVGEGRDTIDTGGRLAVLGSAYDDVFVGTAANEAFEGRDGSDQIRSGGGDDFIRTDTRNISSGASADVVVAGDGDDFVQTGGGRDRVWGGPGNDDLRDYGTGIDALSGGKGNDSIEDELSRHDGEEYLDGGPGRDRVTLFSTYVRAADGSSTASLNMGTGRLTAEARSPLALSAVSFERVVLYAYDFFWTVIGTPYADTVDAQGTGGADFSGRAGDDRFTGSPFDDRFAGGDGSDTNLGMGEGHNTCASVEVDVDASCTP